MCAFYWVKHRVVFLCINIIKARAVLTNLIKVITQLAYTRRSLSARQQIAFYWRAHTCFCGHVPWLYQYWPGGFMFFVVLCPGTPKGSTGSGSGFKASQKTGPRLKVSSDRLGEAGNRTCDPWFTRRAHTGPLSYANWIENLTWVLTCYWIIKKKWGKEINCKTCRAFYRFLHQVK